MVNENTCKGRKEVYLNNTLNTFYLRSYGVGHMVMNNSDSEREETHCCHYMGYSLISSKIFYMHHPTGWHTPTPLLPVLEHWQTIYAVVF